MDRHSADEWDALATALNVWGIKHVAPSRACHLNVPHSSRELFDRLARSEDPRLQHVAIVLLLTHPRLASEARAVISSLPEPHRDRAMRRYVAAAALQRMARTRISLRLGEQPEIPPAYLAELGLPPASPADFLPVPPSALSRLRYVARFGPVSVYYYDLPSLVIAKAARALERDLDDVSRLLGAGEVDWRDVEETWREMRSSPIGWLRHEPEEVEQRLNLLRQRLASTEQ